MSLPLVVPELGAGDLPIRISTWLVDLGDDVLAGDRVVELVLPGMTFDVASPVSGRLIRIEKYSDSAVRAGDCLGWLEPPEQKSSGEEEQE